MTRKILITGATGAVSSATLAALKGSKASIRAMVRSEEKGAVLKAMGVEVVLGDLDKPKSLAKAFEGIDTAWVLTTNGVTAPVHSSNALWAARKAGVSHIVRMSAVGAAHNAPTINSRLHALADSELKSSGVAYTILRPHFFMQNLMMSAASVAKEGTMYWALGEGRLGMVDVRDIGDFTAKVLTSGGHEGKTYDITGPESVNLHQVAEAFSAALKKPVKYQPVSIEQAIEGMTKMGMPEFGVNMMGDYLNAYSSNWGDSVSTHFKDVTGRAPRSIADFARDFAGAFSSK